MSNFFQSDIVRESIKDLEKIQKKLVEETMRTPYMTKDEKKDHIELMRTFLEKQKNLYLRLSLSDDPEAIEMKERMKDAAKFLGFEGDEVSELFSEMEQTLKRLDKATEME